MRVIAEFAMRSRAHALGVALAGTILPLMQWMACGAIGLVTLRHGLREGTFVMIVVLAPHMVVFSMTPNPNLLAVLIPLQTAILAGVLRQTRSWQLTVVGAPVLGAVLMLLTHLIGPAAIEAPLRLASELTGRDLLSEPGTYQRMLPLFAFLVTGASLTFLALGRWWQSVLFNPGGFGTEFQALRLSPRVAVSIVVAIFLCIVLLPGSYSLWFLPLTVPLIVAALGLVHFVVNQRKLGNGPLAAYYITLGMGLITIVLLPFLLLPAVLDSFLDLRRRMNPNND